MKRIKNIGNAVLTVRGIGPFNPGEAKEVPDDVAQELVLCGAFEEEKPVAMTVVEPETEQPVRRKPWREPVE